MNNNDINYNYYGNYDKNVKAIKGGGVITPSNPPNRKNTTGTINNTWKKNINPVPPLFKSKYYSVPDLTNGYLNSNNFVVNDDYISDYYYPSQKLDKVDTINNKTKKKKNIINNSNPIKFPPPLVTNAPISTNVNTNTSKNKNKNNNVNTNTNKNNFNNKKLTGNDYDFIDFIENNSLYDGKFIYTIENDLINDNNDKFNKITYIPFANKLFRLENNDLENKTIFDSLENKTIFDSLENIEEFQNIQYKNNTNSISNIVLLIIFSILLIIYFSKYQK